MGFRISTSGLYHTAERRLMANLERLYDAQETVMTGKKLRSAGENPSAFTRCVSYKSMARTLDQFERNIASSKGYLSEAENSLRSAANLLARAKEVALQSASGTLDEDTLAGNAGEVDSLYDQMLSLANARWSGGTLRDALETGDTDGVRSTIEDLDRSLSQIAENLSEIGLRSNRLNQTESRLGDIQVSMQEFISQEEDVDLIQAATELTRYDRALSASIRSTRMIFQTMTIL